MTLSRTWRRGLAAVAALALVVAVLALPPVQAAADQLLKIFRVQSVVFVPVEQSRIRELEQLNFDESTLFVAEPRAVVDPGEPAVVPSGSDAAALAGLPALAEPALPEPPTSVEYRVQGRSVMEFQVDVAAAQQLMALAGVTDVTLPPELGSGPITADVPASVISTYRGAGYDLTLTQGVSPQVAVPDGVDLKVLGTAMLRMLGTSPEQAAQLAAQIDWGTTFVFPFPANMSGVSTVNIDGLTGLLVTSREDGERRSQIYWQRGERFYVLQSRGDIDGDALLALVGSIR